MKLKVNEDFQDKAIELRNNIKQTIDYFKGNSTHKLGNLVDATQKEIQSVPDAAKIAQAFNRNGGTDSYHCQVDRSKGKLRMTIDVTKVPHKLVSKLKPDGEWYKLVNTYDEKSKQIELIFDADDLPDKMDVTDKEMKVGTNAAVGKKAASSSKKTEDIDINELIFNEGLELSDPSLDNDVLHIEINSKPYNYTIKDDSQFSIEVLLDKVKKIMKHSHGRALQFLLKNTNMVATESFFDDDESDEDESQFTMIDHKSVPDADGFMTDYTMYRDIETGEYVFVFGDRDIYGPEDGNFDWSCDTEAEAREWFDNYKGFTDEEGEPDESTRQFITIEMLKGLSEDKKVSFKDHHICDGCGNPLSSCTCKVATEDEVEESLNEDFVEESDESTYDRDLMMKVVKKVRATEALQLNESSDDKDVIITLKVRDDEGSIRNLLDCIKTTASIGHSFPVVVDPHDEDRKQEFYIDGDGCDKIWSIEIQEPEKVEESVVKQYEIEYIEDGRRQYIRELGDSKKSVLSKFKSSHPEAKDIVVTLQSKIEESSDDSIYHKLVRGRSSIPSSELVKMSVTTLKKMLKDASPEDAKKIKAELNVRGIYPRGKGPKSVTEGTHVYEGDRVKLDNYMRVDNGAIGTLKGKIGQLCTVEWDDGTKTKEIDTYLVKVDEDVQESITGATQPSAIPNHPANHLKLNTDKCDELSVCPVCNSNRFNDKTGLCIDCGYDEKSDED